VNTRARPADFEALAEKTFLITGADGMLGRAFQECLRQLDPRIQVIALDREALNVTDREAVLGWASARPDFILHCAANVHADACERDQDTCRAIQVGGTTNVAVLAGETGARLYYPQSVFIFDGRDLPVTESTRPSPAMAYGRFKLEAEQRMLDLVPDALVVRMAGFFGGDDKDKNFVGQFTRRLADALAAGISRVEVGDRIWQPTYTLDAAGNALLLLALGKTGVYHMGAHGEATFFDVAAACVEFLGLSSLVAIVPGSSSAFAAQEFARRPMRMVTATERLDHEGLNRQRYWRDALREYLGRPYFAGQFESVTLRGSM
jgi:dTDP-4-dehydrorhamnose reductase